MTDSDLQLCGLVKINNILILKANHEPNSSDLFVQKLMFLGQNELHVNCRPISLFMFDFFNRKIIIRLTYKVVLLTVKTLIALE